MPQYCTEPLTKTPSVMKARRGEAAGVKTSIKQPAPISVVDSSVVGRQKDKIQIPHCMGPLKPAFCFYTYLYLSLIIVCSDYSKCLFHSELYSILSMCVYIYIYIYIYTVCKPF